MRYSKAWKTRPESETILYKGFSIRLDPWSEVKEYAVSLYAEDWDYDLGQINEMLPYKEAVEEGKLVVDEIMEKCKTKEDFYHIWLDEPMDDGDAWPFDSVLDDYPDDMLSHDPFTGEPL